MLLLDSFNDVPEIVQDYLAYLANVGGKSEQTIKAYHTDIKFLLKTAWQRHGNVDPSCLVNEISITGIDIDFIRTITTEDVLYYRTAPLYSSAPVSVATKCRRTASAKHFFLYLYENKKLLKENICSGIDNPPHQNRKYSSLSIKECQKLLNACDGDFAERDFAIIMLFLSCGLRISELVMLNLSDIQGNLLHVPGNRTRYVYLTDESIDALNKYISVRNNFGLSGDDRGCLFVSKKHRRIGVRAVEKMLERNLEKAEIDKKRISPQNLRDTAAMLMYKNGIDTMIIRDILGTVTIDPGLFRKPEDMITLISDAAKISPRIFDDD